MTKAEEIHHSINDSDDIEEVWETDIKVGDVFRNLVRHPGQIITRWNWKTALIGAIIRASFYVVVYLASRESWIVILTAVGVEFPIRFFTTGLAGAVVQSFRRAVPQWLATAIISVSLPAITHIIEFFTHYLQEKYLSEFLPASENSGRQKAFAISVLFSVVSAIFNLFMMRRGVMLVGAGEETQTLWHDVKKIPLLITEFVIYLPNLLVRFVGEGKIIYAAGVFMAFGLSVGAILGTTRGVWNWAYRSAFGAWALLFASALIAALVMRILQTRRGL